MNTDTNTYRCNTEKNRDKQKVIINYILIDNNNNYKLKKEIYLNTNENFISVWNLLNCLSLNTNKTTSTTV